MLLVGIITTFGGVALVQGDPLMIVIYFYRGTGIMDSGFFSYVTIGYATYS
tara:strand:- start:1818 stop:1970 length:153 start_codon:yes stop_codon:yes gene_type:complete